MSTLGRPKRVIQQHLATLVHSRVASDDGHRYALVGGLTVDTRTDPTLERKVREHWLTTASRRVRAPRENDVFSYNVFSIARADFAKLAQLQREFYRGVRALIAESEPTDVAGLLVMHLLEWDPSAAIRTD
jgi:hypothetical protein